MSKQEQIGTLEGVQASLSKIVYELRCASTPDTEEAVKDGPRLVLAELVKKCTRAQTRFQLGSTTVQAQPDSMVNDLLYVSAIMDMLSKRVEAAKGAEVDDLVKRLKDAEQTIGSQELTLADIRRLMINCGTNQAPVMKAPPLVEPPEVAPGALPTYQDAFAIAHDPA